MVRAGFAIRLDPFAAEYDAAVQWTETDEATATVDVGVERATWDAVRPSPAADPRRVFFVDGVRRVEQRLLIEEPERTLFGLLGSFGVGATGVEGRAARVRHESVSRVFVSGGGAVLPALAAAVAGGRATVTFEPRSVPENTPPAVVDGLQAAMRENEARLADELGHAADIVLLDGPLTFLASTTGPVVGYVKRLVRPYLAGPEAALLRRLDTGERTPLFLIHDAPVGRYSWYQRIARGRAIESGLTGVVRLETSARRPLQEARALADAACLLLPRFASDPAHDPRAPHNLHPIGGLESRLRRLLGDPLLIRRAVEAHLHREATA